MLVEIQPAKIGLEAISSEELKIQNLLQDFPDSQSVNCGDRYGCGIISDKHTVRGPDGGCSICGGTGSFLGWLPLATAYWQTDVLEWLDEGISGNFMRRVIPLP